MKKILLVIGVLLSVVAYGQLPHYQTNATNFNWTNHTKFGKSIVIPIDTLSSAPDSSIAILNSVFYQKLGYWRPVSSTVSNLSDKLLDGGSVSYKGYGFNFYVQEAVYRIANLPYNSDSVSITLSASDPDDPRKDVIYLATDGAVHVLEGTPAPSAAEPQLDGNQIKLTVIDIPAGSTTPAFGQEMLYNENIEWTVTQSGATIDADYTTNPWIGSKSIHFTNVNQGDLLYLTRPLGTLSMLNWQANSISIKLLAILPPTSFVRVTFFYGSLQVSNERPINLNRNVLGWQAVSIPTSDFVFSNYNIDKVRIRYTNSAGAAVYAGFDLDYIHFISGYIQPGGGSGGGDFSATLSIPGGGIVASPATITNNGTWTLQGAGSSSQYLDGTLALRSFTAWHTPGAIDGVAKTANGFGVSGNIFYQQYADATYPGLFSAFNYRRLDTAANRSVENLPGGDTILTYINQFSTGIKSFVAGDNMTITATDTTLVFESTGGGSPDGNGIYDGSGSLTGNTVVTLGGNSLGISQSGIPWLNLDPAFGASALKAIDGNNESGVYNTVDGTTALQEIIASYNNGAKLAKIEASATSTIAKLSMTGDIHLNSLTAGVSTDSVMTFNTSTKKVGYKTISYTTTANNGLTMSTSTNVQLGGTALSGNTSIPTSAYSLTIASSAAGAAFIANNSVGSGMTGLAGSAGSGVWGVGGNADNGYGVYGITATGRALYGAASGNGWALVAQGNTGIAAWMTNNNNSQPTLDIANTTTTNYSGITDVFRMARYSTTGTPAAGYGQAITFITSVTTGPSTTATSGSIINRWTTVATNTTSTSQMAFQVNNAGTLIESFKLNGNGSLIASNYGDGTFRSGTPTTLLASNTSGDILEVPLGQGVDVASVAGAITLGGAGNVFEITGTDAITLISNLIWQNGSVVTLLFTSTASLTDGTANSGTNIGMELNSNTNFSATADDTITLVLS